MADNSLPKTPERDLDLVTSEQVKEIRVIDTSDNSKTLAINNLTIAGTKVTVAVDGLSGTVDGAFGDVLTAIAEKADTTQVEALDAEKVNTTDIEQVRSQATNKVPASKLFDDELVQARSNLNEISGDIDNKLKNIIYASGYYNIQGLFVNNPSRIHIVNKIHPPFSFTLNDGYSVSTLVEFNQDGSFSRFYSDTVRYLPSLADNKYVILSLIKPIDVTEYNPFKYFNTINSFNRIDTDIIDLRFSSNDTLSFEIPIKTTGLNAYQQVPIYLKNGQTYHFKKSNNEVVGLLNAVYLYGKNGDSYRINNLILQEEIVIPSEDIYFMGVAVTPDHVVSEGNLVIEIKYAASFSHTLENNIIENKDNIEKAITEKSFKNNDRITKLKFSDFKIAGQSDSDTIDRCLAFGRNISNNIELTIDQNITISRVILLPSNTKVIIDNVKIKMSNYMFDNIFRAMNLPLADAGLSEFLDDPSYNLYTNIPTNMEWCENISIIGIGTAELEGPDINKKDINNSNYPCVSDYYGLKTHTINFNMVDGVEISGLNIHKIRGWTVCLSYCKNAKIHDLVINGHDLVDEPEGNGANSDGVDIRNGCSNIDIYNIEADTNDDSVVLNAIDRYKTLFYPYDGAALTADANLQNGTWKIEDTYIHNVRIDNITKNIGKLKGVAIYISTDRNIHDVSVTNVIVGAGVSPAGSALAFKSLKLPVADNSIYNVSASNIKNVNGLAVSSDVKCNNILINKPIARSVSYIKNISDINGFAIYNETVEVN